MRDEQYILNCCTPYLARTNFDDRHNFGVGHFSPGDVRGKIREAWRFPVIDTCANAPAGSTRAEFNDVTFIYMAEESAPLSVAVVGTFGKLYEAVPLRRIQFLAEDTPYYAVTVTVPRRSIFFYKFIIDGKVVADLLNPQTVTNDNGSEWSRFFTWECSAPVFFEPWELAIVQRFCNHILPFRTREGQRFLSYYYDGLDRDVRRDAQRRAYRMDDSAGAATYIDHILAREECHHQVDYTLCLREIRRLLRQRDPDHEPVDVSKDLYVELYEEMAKNKVAGWNSENYSNPRYFLDLLRRHSFTGAFSHPKYGGNASLAGWNYLKTELAPGQPAIFDWGRSQESPMGKNLVYLG